MPWTPAIGDNSQETGTEMPKVVAQIVIDSEEWDSSLFAVGENTVMYWKRSEVTRAHPFAAHEMADDSLFQLDEFAA
jgi:hypothetical protein